MWAASVTDIFCGIGGLTHGFVKEDFNVIAGIDVDSSCKYAYEKNNGAKFIDKSVDEITVEEIINLYPENDIKIMVGCAPCQPFSKYTNKESEDEEWQLVGRFAELIRGVQPEIVSMENVPELEEHPIFLEFIDMLEDEEYSYSWSNVECVDYGVPQTRTRLVLFASKFGEIEIIPKTHYPGRQKTVRQAIGDLEPLQAGQASPRDPIHCSSRLSEVNIRRIMSTPPGGGWKDWPEDLLLECHKKETGKSYGSVYGRMAWDEPAPTITTQCNGLGNGRFGHPEQHRAISLREAALLQTFPRYYHFIEPRSKVFFKRLARQIGNAVPPRLGRIIARTIKKHLETIDA
jgi:DNA (cytosine-5)-methyltransferase 1